MLLYIAPIRHVAFHCKDEPTAETVTSSRPCDQDQGHLVVIDDVAVSLHCLVIGGYPPPTVSVYVGNDDVTKQFVMTSRDSALEGSRGLRQMIYSTKMSTDSLTFRSYDDGTVLRCVVNVPGLSPTYSQTTVRVLCKTPLFTTYQMLQ